MDSESQTKSGSRGSEVGKSAVRGAFGGVYEQITVENDTQRSLYTPPTDFVGTPVDYYVAGSYQDWGLHLIEGSEYRETVLQESGTEEGYNPTEHRPYTLCNQTNASDHYSESRLYIHFLEWLLKHDVAPADRFPDRETMTNRPKRIALKQIPATPGAVILSRLCGNCDRIYTGDVEIESALETVKRVNERLPG